MHFERCKKCKSLLKPNVVLFNELLSHENVEKIDDELKTCDLFFIVRQIFGFGKIRKNRKKSNFKSNSIQMGTSGLVYPAAGYGEYLSSRKVPIAEFNIENEPTCPRTKYA